MPFGFDLRDMVPQQNRSSYRIAGGRPRARSVQCGSVFLKGLAGRFAPIGVHLAILLIMGGGTLSAVESFKGSVTVPQGLNFIVGDVFGPSGFLSFPAFNTEVHVNRFFMDYYDSGEVRWVHHMPDRLELAALQIMKDDEGPFNLAMALLKINGDKKLYGTFLPVGSPDSPDVKGISMVARDLQSIVLYDLEGKFAGIRWPNSKLPIEINGNKIVIVDAIGSTGLDLKTDPGVPVVYAGFGFLMLTTCISFLSHSQGHQDGKSFENRPTKGSCPSWAWASLLQRRELLMKGVRWQIQNGASVDFWVDKWIPSLPSFCIQSTKPPWASNNKVADFINPTSGEWRIAKLRQVLSEEEVQAVANIPISKLGGADSIIWGLHPSGKYTVKRGYHKAWAD
ncbi:hypothetical protein RHMOL_Rhmol05G0091000 [Rhododendron molle]|uniref:Uncharacterized protein n=1 Tax=Rhododendron molle TaxID=49168 RepID=A0ACC0NN05_RHOML|nr:hypothetical protein RHMOL_Rhmol05G0091000 [Rhododendron molle]